MDRYSQALHRYRPQDAAIRRFSPCRTRATGTDAITICEDRLGYLWVGTYGHGLFRFDPRTRLFQTFPTRLRKSEQPQQRHRPTVFVDHNGTFWAATHDGLDRFDADDEQLHHIQSGTAKSCTRIIWQSPKTEKGSCGWARKLRDFCGLTRPQDKFTYLST